MLEHIKVNIPEVAKDIRLNLGKVLEVVNDGLTTEQLFSSALAVAYTLEDDELIEGLKQELVNTELIRAAQLAASLMAMTNIYYRFVHLTEDAEVGHIPAGLRMQGMMNPGIDKVTFELLCLAVSAVNGCGTCVSSHTHQLREHGLSAGAIAHVGRISAVINAVSVSRKIL